MLLMEAMASLSGRRETGDDARSRLSIWRASAVVYVRQSTAFQVVHNLESQRRQYGLAERARQLGWADVEVIDDDLGRSGSGRRDDQASRSCWRRSARAASAPCYRLRPHVSRATDATGTRCWSSADWLVR